jgi:SAM-dependent methyltransferase
MRSFRRWLDDFRHPTVRRGRPEEVWLRLIERLAPSRTFVDVGCMWKVDGAYAFHALAHGATEVTGVDINPATPEFEARNRAERNRVRFVQADLNDPELPARVGSFDVVFCSGVLYHVPNMQQSLDQLRRLCRGTLILATASITERETPNAAVFLPYMDPVARDALNFVGPYRKRGLDSDILPERGYANWLWLPTASCLRAMTRFAGFEVDECIEHRRATTIVARAATVATRWGSNPPLDDERASGTPARLARAPERRA